ncbi:MAG: hypothetical protein HY905_12440 [Deltaproteobacteria bacterium]|nr:hypothetical protein [Deltaproteobacteria bacterium]
MRRIRFGLPFLGVVLLAVASCATPPQFPLPADNPFQLPALQLERSPESPQLELVTYRPDPRGQGRRQSQDGVTVTLTAEVAAGPEVVQCLDPDGSEFPVRLPRLGLLIRIENGTGHILRMAGSVLVVEDEDGRAWPIIRSGMTDVAALASNTALERYSEYRTQISAFASGAQAALDRTQLSPGYAAQWNGFRQEWQKCMDAPWDGSESICGLRSEVEWGEPGNVLSNYRASAEAQLGELVSRVTATVDQAAHACAEALRLAAPRQDLPIIDQATFGMLSILPEHYFDGYIAIDPAVALGGPPTLRLCLYDLTTATDAAAQPSVRKQFCFRLDRVDSAAGAVAPSGQ